MNDTRLDDFWTFSEKEITLATQIRQTLQPIAEAIGLIAMQWNSIHNELGNIFACVTELDEDAAYTKWNSFYNDRKQRELLRTETEKKYQNEKYIEARKNIIGLLDKIDTLSSRRNSSVHCPFTLLIEGGELRVIPDNQTKNRHAESLSAVDLLPALQERIGELDELDLRAQYVLLCLRILELGEPWPSESF